MIKWSTEQQELRAALSRRCDALSEGHLLSDRIGKFPWHKWKLIQESNLLQLPIAEEWGGLDQNLLTTVYLLEELGYGCRDAGLNFSVATHIVSTGIPLQRFGSRALKDKYMSRLCDGSAIGAHAISEPEHGSDIMNMRTKAVQEDGYFRLTGSKVFVSNGPIADLFVVYTRTGVAGTATALSAFLVERDTPGLRVGEPIEKMGLRSSPLAEIAFDDCRIPAENLIGELGAGFLIQDYVMKWEILCSFAINLGEMRHRVERCITYANERRQFGQPIANYQAVAHKIVEMKIGLETAGKWVFETAEKIVNGEDSAVDVAITKLVTSEANVASALAAVQIFGGYGYMAEYGLEKEVRNAVGSTIYSGTSEIQRNRIAALIGL